MVKIMQTVMHIVLVHHFLIVITLIFRSVEVSMTIAPFNGFWLTFLIDEHASTTWILETLVKIV